MKYLYSIALLFIVTAPVAAFLIYDRHPYPHQSYVIPTKDLRLLAPDISVKSSRQLFFYEESESIEPEEEQVSAVVAPVVSISPEPVVSSNIRYVGSQEFNQTQSVFVTYGEEYYIVKVGEYIADEYLLEHIGEQEITVRGVAQSESMTIRMEGAGSE